MKNEWDQAAPSDWTALVNERADLDVAFQALEGWDHFHTDTIRGRIRSLQLRPREAWDFFEKAAARTAQFGNSLRNILRRFYLKVYRFENAIMEESQPLDGQPSRAEECLRDLLHAETPDSEAANQVRTFNRAVYLLHREDYSTAKGLFLTLIQSSRNRHRDEQTGFYLGAAVVHRALEEEPEADRQMENAALSIPALSNTFNMGIFASSAGALLRLWGREEEAREWDEFLVRLKIPPKTVELFRERSRRILERSQSLQRVFLF